MEAEDRRGPESLLQHMERAPVSLDRLAYRLDGRAHYRGNLHPGLSTDHRLVSGVEFLALMVPHVLLRYQVVIRSYGAVSTTIRRQLGWIGKERGAGPGRRISRRGEFHGRSGQDRGLADSSSRPAR